MIGRSLRMIAAVVGVSAMVPLAAIAQESAFELKVKADLIAAETGIVPGQPLLVAMRQRITPGWHTYWKNPGDSGLAPELKWQLPDGFKVSDILWPVPDAIPVGPLMNYGYSDEVLLLMEITAPVGFSASEVDLAADAEWLVCEDICIPESGRLSLTLPVVSGPAAPSAEAPVLEEARRALPIALPWSAKAHVSAETVVLSVAATELDRDRIVDIAFFPATWGHVNHSAPQPVSWTADGFGVQLARGDLKDEPLDRLEGILAIEERIDGATVRHGFTVEAQAVDEPAAAGIPAAAAADGRGGGIGLWQAMLFAMLGGLILNLMPCVLPILSLKALALARHGEHSRAEALGHGGAYLAGVLASFAILAVLLIALRNAGAAFGWGFQFQSPAFVLAMAALFLALGLSLSGVFRIGAGVVGAGDKLGRKSGPTGSFFTGALATIAATPCTAPFMGVAIGYAMARPAPEIVAVLLALGAGFALPIVALSVTGTAARLLPRPGPWMLTLQQVLAFPLYATAAWLVWVLSIQTGSDGVLGAAVVLVAVGFSAWLYGRMSGGQRVRTAIAATVIIAALAAVMPRLEIQTVPVAQAGGSERGAEASFSEVRLAELRAEGRPVFVNFTAAWCISCKVNEKVALSSARFHAAMAAKDVAYLKGDWTNQDEEITRVLKRFGRAGVPLYLLYPPGRDSQAIVLPQILTEGLVLRHIEALPDPPTVTRTTEKATGPT
jgi:thiol:disulfide interchange protein DsbD